MWNLLGQPDGSVKAHENRRQRSTIARMAEYRLSQQAPSEGEAADRSATWRVLQADERLKNGHPLPFAGSCDRHRHEL